MSRRSRYALVAAGIVLCAALWLWPDTSGSASFRARWNDPLVERDLDGIRKDTLRVLVIEHPLVFQRLKGSETGLEYELLERFARRARLAVRPVVVHHVDSLLPMLQRGEGDVIAARLGERNHFRKAIARTRPFRFIAPVIASLRADRVLGIEAGPSPDTVWANEGTPFIDRNDDDRISLRTYAGRSLTVLLDTSSTADAALVNLALGRVRAAVISDAMAAYAATRFPQLRFSEPIADAQPLFFGVRRNSVRLREAIDAWLTDPEEKEAHAMLMSAYGARIPERGPLGRKRKLTVQGDSLSPYDSLFQEHQLRHDWELLAAIAFKESRFDSSAVSDRGAQGLMQMMPRTAEGMGTDSMHLVQGQVQAAAKYLATLDTIWLRRIPKTDERLRFVLAAYNAGPGHVLDAQRLASELGLDPNVWEGNVERTITLLALPQFFTRPDVQSGPCQGSQTFNYVREVTGLYEQFRDLTGAR